MFTFIFTFSHPPGREVYEIRDETRTNDMPVYWNLAPEDETRESILYNCPSDGKW